MRIVLMLVFGVFCLSGAAQASECYTPREAEAEQGIRIHSELMVIALNCAHMANANGNNLYVEHRKFTSKYGDLFATYERIMIEHMRKRGIKNPEAQMTALRTDFANKISADAAEMRPDVFCKTYAPRIEKATKMDETTFRKWAATPFKGHPVTRPMCKA